MVDPYLRMSPDPTPAVGQGLNGHNSSRPRWAPGDGRSLGRLTVRQPYVRFADLLLGVLVDDDEGLDTARCGGDGIPGDVKSESGRKCLLLKVC